MPSSATITSFYSFVAGTKARATQVNTNFSQLRGHIIAIDPNTAAAAPTNTYDLGSEEYYWRSLYAKRIQLLSSTSTGSTLEIRGDTATAGGAFNFNIQGTTRAVIGTSGIDGAYIKTQSISVTARSLAGITSAAAAGQMGQADFAVGPYLMSTSSILFGSDVPGSTLTIDTVGRPVLLCLTGATAASQVTFAYKSLTSIAVRVGGSLNIVRDGVTVGQVQFGVQQFNFTTTAINVSAATGAALLIFPMQFTVIDVPAAGNHKYYAYLGINGQDSGTYFNLTGRLQAIEL